MPGKRGPNLFGKAWPIVVKQPGAIWRPDMLAAKMGIRHEQAIGVLQTLHNQGKLERLRRGEYKITAEWRDVLKQQKEAPASTKIDDEIFIASLPGALNLAVPDPNSDIETVLELFFPNGLPTTKVLVALEWVELTKKLLS